MAEYARRLKTILHHKTPDFGDLDGTISAFINFQDNLDRGRSAIAALDMNQSASKLIKQTHHNLRVMFASILLQVYCNAPRQVWDEIQGPKFFSFVYFHTCDIHYDALSNNWGTDPKCPELLEHFTKTKTIKLLEDEFCHLALIISAQRSRHAEPHWRPTVGDCERVMEAYRLHEDHERLKKFAVPLTVIGGIAIAAFVYLRFGRK
eukprot:Opistho-2@3517